MFENREGRRVPSVTFKTRSNHDWVDVDSAELFDGRTVVVFALPGAFTPTCSAAHLPRYEALVDAIRSVLQRAIRAGGTTLRDYYGGSGEAGWFQQQLDVYGREDEPCRVCDRPITAIVQGQRATYYCPRCQR